MMEIEQITAQIFLRSEEKKKALRAKRRRLAAGVVSVGLCFCLAVVLTPQFSHKNADSIPMPESSGTDPGTNNGLILGTEYSTVQDGQTNNTMPTVILIVNPQKIAQLTALLDFDEIVPESPEGDDKGEIDPDYSYSMGTVQAYFTCVTQERKTRYQLCGDVVIRLDDMCEKHLSKQELAELYQLLELPEA